VVQKRNHLIEARSGIHQRIGVDLVLQVLEGRGRRVSIEIFYRPLKMRNWGDGGGLTVSWN